jgi:hypothetical protein
MLLLQLKLLVLRWTMGPWFWWLHNPGHLKVARHLHSQVLVLTRHLSLTPHLRPKLQSHGRNEPTVVISGKQEMPGIRFRSKIRSTSSITMRPIVHEVSPWDLGCEKSVSETKGARIFTKERICEISLWEKKVQTSRVCDVSLWDYVYVNFHSEEEKYTKFSLHDEGYVMFVFETKSPSDTNRYVNFHSGKKGYMKFHYQMKGCVCMYVCMCIYIYICIYTHICQTILLRWKGVFKFHSETNRYMYWEC